MVGMCKGGGEGVGEGGGRSSLILVLRRGVYGWIWVLGAKLSLSLEEMRRENGGGIADYLCFCSGPVEMRVIFRYDVWGFG